MSLGGLCITPHNCSKSRRVIMQTHNCHDAYNGAETEE